MDRSLTHDRHARRRSLRLTAAGKDLVQRCSLLLEGRFAGLVAAAGVPYAEYAGQTRRLVRALGESR